MAEFNKLHGADNSGFDPDNFWQVVPVGRTSAIYLEGGDDYSVECEDDSVASASIVAGEGTPLKKIVDAVEKPPRTLAQRSEGMHDWRIAVDESTRCRISSSSTTVRASSPSICPASSLPAPSNTPCTTCSI